MILFRLLLRRKLVLLSLSIISGLVLMAAFAPWLAPHDPNEVDLERKLSPPSRSHLLGTDHLGRDTPVPPHLWGTGFPGRPCSSSLSWFLSSALVVGCTAGYAGGWLDSFLMRVCDVFLTFPTFILAMFLIGVLGTGMVNVILAIVLTHWAWYARIIRSLTLSLKTREYVMASRVAGTNQVRLVLRHLVPPVAAQLVILATLDTGHMMLHVSGLSFLGLGIQPPTPEWGVMINDARQYLWTHSELILYPGLMIFLTVMAFNIPGGCAAGCS